MQEIDLIVDLEDNMDLNWLPKIIDKDLEMVEKVERALEKLMSV